MFVIYCENVYDYDDDDDDDDDDDLTSCISGFTISIVFVRRIHSIYIFKRYGGGYKIVTIQ